ncbi:MAG: hypothetical protein ACE5FU_09345, partial [Nitrospinota bacterium]
MAFKRKENSVKKALNENGNARRSIFSSKKIGTKLMTAFLCIGLIPFLILAAVSVQKAGTALESGAFHQLEGIREIKKKEIEGFFHERKADMHVLVNT